MLGRSILILCLACMPSASALAQFPRARASAVCRCVPDGKPRKPKLLLPVVGGLGFIPVTIAARDSQLPLIGLPALVDIRDTSPRNALEGERALEVGALAPNTATSLPTVMVVSVLALVVGVYLALPRRRRRRSRGRRDPRTGAAGYWRLRSIHRRRVGAAIASIGGLMCVLGVREYAEGAEAQRQARAEWMQMGETFIRLNDSAADATPDAPPSSRLANREIETSLTVDSPRSVSPGTGPASVVPLPVFAVSGREIRRGTPVARLLIPSIDLDEIVTEGVSPIELNGGPGHFPGSVLPGEQGNAIVSAHRDRHFRRVGELGVGSRIRTETRIGATDWVITERRIVSRDSPSLFEESTATLTLTTCWPLRYFGPAPDRLLIIAKPAP